MVDRARAANALQGLNGALGASGGNYPAVRASYLISLSEAAQSFLDGGNPRGTVNAAQRAMVEAYGAVADELSGGGLEGADLAFFNAEVEQERSSIESLWADLKLQRADGNTQLPADRIEMYGRSLDALYNELKGRQQRNAFATWELGDAENHCAGRGSCTWLDGQRHRIKWYLDKGYIPGKPGAAQVCGGWQCKCKWRDDQGNLIMVQA